MFFSKCCKQGFCFKHIWKTNRPADNLLCWCCECFWRCYSRKGQKGFLLLFDCQLSPVEHLQNGTHYELGLAIVGKKIVLLLWCLERVSTCGLYSNSWGRWIGDHLKKGLAKFGYRLKRKVEKFRNPATCWWHGPIFSKKKPFIICKPYFFVTRMPYVSQKNNCWFLRQIWKW